MVFEKLEKRMQGATGIANDEVSISKSVITFGTDLSNEFNKVGYVEIWLDKSANQIGFKPTSNPTSGFRISKDKQRQDKCQLVLSKRQGYFPIGRYKFIKVNNMFVINVPEIAESSEKTVVKPKVLPSVPAPVPTKRSWMDE